MKFLECPQLASLNTALSERGVDLGSCVAKGTLTAWSCKLAGTDKKLSASIEQEVVSSLHDLPASISTSPVGPLTDPSSRKTLIFLILTLNHVFPDYDFSCLRGHHFRKEEGLEATRELVNGQLLEPARMFGAFAATPELETLWSRLEEVIVPSECDIYSYTAEAEGDPFSELGALWSWNRFFFNRKQKRIVCFTCTGVRKRAEDGDDSQLSEEGDFATWDAADMDE